MIDHILIVGLGSIGRRHLRHFRSLGVKRIDALRSGKATLADEGQPQPDNTYTSIEDALAQKPAAAIICTPSSLHTSYVLAALKQQIPVLCEKPLTHLHGEALQIESAAGNTPVFIAHNLRFHKGLAWIREQILQNTFGKPLMAQAHFGAYLPDWHSWEDYKESYAAKKDLGGGAALTHTHEPDYLGWLFGGITSSFGFDGNIHSLGTDVDEQSSIILKHPGGVISSISLSINQKPAQRYLHIQFDKGTLNFDQLQRTISFTRHDGTTDTYDLLKDYDVDETYRLQAEAFIKAINGTQTELCTLKEGIILVQTATKIH
jgi:predicted dehydrogenase